MLATSKFNILKESLPSSPDNESLRADRLSPSACHRGWPLTPLDPRITDTARSNNQLIHSRRKAGCGYRHLANLQATGLEPGLDRDTLLTCGAHWSSVEASSTNTHLQGVEMKLNT
ncbi:hypothetical protein RRG08_016873 [Elysia crispata]|uniref:Uncharacterized protein n=1 Tax=Elysia crispata TaxID=231223 RepID=A0AAE0XMJ6_9GAST|nr:hypothetical protein RRG08_016873 [Elysia crispata]